MKISLKLIALAFCLFAVPALALATVKAKNVTFGEDVKVGDTTVKKGDYKVRYDDQTNELTVFKNKKMIAKATAHLEDRKDQSIYQPVYTTHSGKDGLTLTSVNLGEKYAVITGNQASGASQTPSS